MTLDLPPVHSPLRWKDLVQAAGALRPSASEEAATTLRCLLRDRFEADAVVPCSSGTHALQLALRLGAEARAGTRSGGRRECVALPAYGCYDLATAAIGAGLEVTFYDLDVETLGPELASLDRALDEGAGLVVAAPLYGIPLDWARLEGHVRGTGVVLIEDAAQGAGAEWAGRPAGTLGTLSVLSFGRGKGWTGGGGGALLARGAFEGPARALRAAGLPGPPAEMRIAGAALAQWALARPGVYGLPARIPGLHLGETVYHPPTPVRGIAGFSALLALSTAEASRAERDLRRERAARWQRRLQEAEEAGELRSIRPPEGGLAGYLRFPVLVPGGLEGRQQRARIRRLGGAPPYPQPLPSLPPLQRRLRGTPSAMPGAERLVADLFTLPTHRYVTARTVDTLSALVLEGPDRLVSAP